MLFKRFGQNDLPVIILLHGGGLSDWSLTRVIDKLTEHYCIITPIIDGHGEDSEETFVSIEDSADKLIRYIDTECNGKVYAIGGLSIGAQIVVDVLSKRKSIAQYALIESALVYPIKGTKTLAVPIYQICYGLIKKRWFAKLQAKSLFVKDDMFMKYYEDSIKMSKQTLINITLSNGTYTLKDSIKNSTVKSLIIVGEKELKLMKKSSQRLNESIPGSKLHVAKGMGHGEISLVYPDQYINLIMDFIKAKA